MAEEFPARNTEFSKSIKSDLQNYEEDPPSYKLKQKWSRTGEGS